MIINICHLRFWFSHASQKMIFLKQQSAVEVKEKKILPDQYPKNLSDTTPMIRRGRPVRYLTPRMNIPQTQMMTEEDKVVKEQYNNEWKSPANAYGLRIGLIGPVNAGKSQLLGRLAHKISAVTPKANTTNEVTTALKSYEVDSEEGMRSVQLKYYDTPGVKRNKTGYLSRGWTVLKDIDFSLLIVDSARRFDDLIKESIKRLQQHRDYENFMKALVLNKVDLVDNKRKFHSLISEVEKYGKFDKIFYTSAETGYGVGEMEEYLIRMARRQEWDHPKEARTEESGIGIIEEMFREGLYRRTYKEVPYKLVVECTSFAARSDGKDEMHLKVFVQSENQQRMVIGLKGKNIRWIIEHTKVQYAQMYGKEAVVYVKVHIKPGFLPYQVSDTEESYYDFKQTQKIKAMEEYFDSVGKRMQY